MSKRECRNGSHEFVEGAVAGAGLSRSACRACGWVSIDLTNDAMARPLRPALFGGQARSIFADVSVGTDLLAPRSSFGQPRTRH